jgi:hypothetical protein
MIAFFIEDFVETISTTFIESQVRRIFVEQNKTVPFRSRSMHQTSTPKMTSGRARVWKSSVADNMASYFFYHFI